MLKVNEKVISEKDIQLEEKEEEIERLKNEISQAKEKKKEDDELSRILTDLEEIRESNVNMNTQLEEAKRREEVVKNNLNEREESCHKLEAEVVDLRKKVDKSNTHVKFMNNSTILDEILDIQRSQNDKSSIGYNKEEVGTPMKLDVGPSFVKGESRYDASPSCSKSESNTTIFKRSDQGRHQEATPTPQKKFRRETPSRMSQRGRY
jgi:predicted nuclease with TOPRIM domain